ncbi:MlaD family protein [Flavobacterium antarcticum]|uniref:MlaD family protein n=1 Tax=Flavobacterium antarcticum TaxID=271155 RepID=UPI00040DA450|nr:MlaD family protein [Flavobacterium antarcticum]
MERKNYKIRLGLFVTAGIILFFLAIFVIGKQKNLFDPVFEVKANFQNVSGLQVGNAVRFSGINVGTVDQITIVNDSTVEVTMLVKKDVQKFIKQDSEAGIGSEGIIGDKLVVLSRGGSSNKIVKEGQLIASSEPVETDAIMESLQITADNAAIATGEITEILAKVNDGKGSLGKLINDDSMADALDATMTNLKTSTKKLDENMEAAKHNFLLRGYFKKKKKAEERKKKEAEKQAAKDKK